MQGVLLLNADHSLLKVVTFERAVWLLLNDQVRMVKQWGSRVVRATSVVVPWPSIVALKYYVRSKGKIRFKRKNILARDEFTCQYCGAKPVTKAGEPDRKKLTMDHVVPRSRATKNQVTLPWNGKAVGVTSWENILTACSACNHRKADRTPDEARMTMLSTPRRPSARESLLMLVSRGFPEEWEEHFR